MKSSQVTQIFLLIASFLVSSVDAVVVATQPSHYLHMRGLPKLVTTSETPTPTSTEEPSTSSTSDNSESSETEGSSTEITSTSESSIYSESVTASSTTSDTDSETSSTTSYTSYTPSTTSVSVGPIYIPSAQNNKYVYHATHPSGTVFTAFGSCLAIIALVLVLVWIALTLRSWKNARKEYQIRERENKYQLDPYYFQNGDKDDYSSSDSDVASDISEKILKKKASRMSLYSLGGGSAFNLLSSEKLDTKPPAPPSNNPRLSMFISPTEILKNEGNTWSTDSSAFNSLTSTPREQSVANIIVPQNGLNKLGDPPFTGKNLSNMDISSTPGVAIPKPNGNQKRGRPPSAHLDDLLDGIQ